MSKNVLSGEKLARAELGSSRGILNLVTTNAHNTGDHTACPLNSPSEVRDDERKDQNRDRCIAERVPSRCNS